jgi:Uma2 family endonuclease
MSPAPTPGHQLISGKLTAVFTNYLSNHKCLTFPAPFDVRFPDSGDESIDDTDTVVQPDISVICDPSKIDKKGCRGAPDIVVEILSPSTGYKDETAKFKLYEKHGVKEYWIVNPETHAVLLYFLENGEFAKPAYFKRKETLTSRVLTNLEIPLEEVFAQLDFLETPASEN